ncbi:MAG: Dual-specificity RNA methyltransferase RlmN [SAR116 cluster bacterium MED-G04]|jgi:23S rRNA (adenine2503-C2)-methyltransferase|nr:23S rRNA (adenine(2503)-C(2))-methyltransferase RlmN [SAR116 cluster bacterium]OUW36232.1 MAG: 23S rRNA (adenine(2503)-C(2))-methyltransferase [Gammaproteobacteria bacterium TMED183]CAI8427366.1 MAG: Dual-specificity RNA methyltransferase RlmN [SAR116 cluster bacterium MED-G04]HCD50644.1 23S rRNA (adenine(2503)-C(2))-methyltransferase RlmN [Alphaproteobacteria bacterium]HCV61717.1 23S rRNA (adenine(2503)-C(2))-methyltransferase RlmN [Alphaproteobacteria bacterium]|tara:strand:+ start:5839 stop:6969 length:1131 start_codon:yes stop_codon:yes gene_type:complete
MGALAEVEGAENLSTEKVDILGLTAEELETTIRAEGLPAFRARQIWRWVWRHGVTRFEDMTDLARPVREQLSAGFMVSRPRVSRRMQSTDGTVKWLLRFPDGNEAETVYIPEDDRGTLCISSQVGCTLTCTFCHTGTQKLVRNLTVAEITGQILLAMDELGDWPAGKPERRLTNIVLMGMGEPLFNYDNVARAMSIAMSGEGVGLSKRRITLSTSGVVPEIDRCGSDLGVNLAISLHAVRDDLRDVLVPINRKYPLETLIEACRNYPSLSNARRITWEYVMLDGVNDSDEDARALIRLIRGIPSKINLIPFNPWPGTEYTCSSPERIERFASIVLKAGYASPVRTPRGSDILAACGQLKSASERDRRKSTRITGSS